jgi:hypothetical protein
MNATRLHVTTSGIAAVAEQFVAAGGRLPCHGRFEIETKP